MNALTTTQSSSAAKPTTPPLTPDLTRWLDDPGSPEAAAREIVDSAPLLAEVRAVLPALRQVAEAKAGERGVRAVIERRFQTYPQPVRSPAEWAAWWADYIDVLEDVTLASLEAGMRAYVADPQSEFMPKPGRLRELAFLSPSRTLQRFQRAKRAIQMADAPLPPECQIEALKPRVKPEEVKAMLEVFEQKSAAGGLRKIELPSIAGKVDERGITQEMRDLIARRASQ